VQYCLHRSEFIASSSDEVSFHRPLSPNISILSFCELDSHFWKVSIGQPLLLAGNNTDLSYHHVRNGRSLSVMNAKNRRERPGNPNLVESVRNEKKRDCLFVQKVPLLYVRYIFRSED
jgi:hypothetical protein